LILLRRILQCFEASVISFEDWIGKHRDTFRHWLAPGNLTPKDRKGRYGWQSHDLMVSQINWRDLAARRKAHTAMRHLP
jgi:hypothetical protein